MKFLAHSDSQITISSLIETFPFNKIVSLITSIL